MANILLKSWMVNLLYVASFNYLYLVTKLGGRHPVTGRKVIEGVGGGSKQKARWIDWLRLIVR